MPKSTDWFWRRESTSNRIEVDEPFYSVADRWNEPWDKLEFKRWALRLRRALLPSEVDLGLVFISSDWIDFAEDIVDVLRSSLGIPTLAGCVSNGVIFNQFEFERTGGIALGLFCLPGGRIVDLGFSAKESQKGITCDEPGFWRRQFDSGSEGINGWIVFADPLHLSSEELIKSWERDFPNAPIYGGLAHFDSEARTSAVIWNDSVIADGGVAVGIGGGVKLLGVTAQGCTPIGDAWTVTKANGNVLERIGNRPAATILEETFQGIGEEMRRRSRGHVFVGLAVDEYLDEFKRGDFLVRNLLAADPSKGSLAVGAFPRVGQSVQFQIRDGKGASEELEELIAVFRRELEEKRIYGACLSSCSGRGMGLFGVEHHDAASIYPLITPQAQVGFFGNGEFGPVGGRNFVHGYTSSAAVFVDV